MKITKDELEQLQKVVEQLRSKLAELKALMEKWHE